MAYLTESELKNKGFKHVGANVLISEDARIYNPELISIGDNTRIDDFCVVSGAVSFGRNVHIAPQCLVAGGEKGITFSDFSGLAYQCQVFAQSDDYSGQTLTNPTVPADYKAEKKAPVVLGRHVIVGAGSLIFPGVTIADGCSVGALSLVNKSTESWGIYVGNPAKRVKERDKGLLDLEQRYLSKG
ncbi:acyltransferase [Idiomarina sp. UBA4520]|uniref:acyltransferase n=1 Tax=Idiomarina sp. UBA4520 TaxID=1946647 RepID=UPI000C4A7457|nr:acyltransferase [Idiomarina sp. UBA4520]MBF39149.1 O-acetyltransferase [Idiomarinaceae bacterium]|tara:strand:- start:30311 stop:30868 length:558 start_codon:yes stop_codon:yes gene_type:complete